jgi:invasion protein IalB
MKRNTRLALIVLAGAIAVAVIAVIAITQFGLPGTTATPAKPTQMTHVPALRGQAFGAWILTCGNTQATQNKCALVMRALDKKTGHVVLSLAVTRGPKGNAILLVSTPPDVSIPAGVVIKPGNANAVRSGFQFCDRQRCEAIFLIDDPLEKALVAAGETGVRFTLPGNRPVGMKLPTKNFQAAYTAWNTKSPAPPQPPAPAKTPVTVHPPVKHKKK